MTSYTFGGNLNTKFFSVGLIVLFSLSGCSLDSSDDGLVGEQPAGPLAPIHDALKSGSGEDLCQQLDFSFSSPCQTIPISTSGSGEVDFEVFDTPTGQIFEFSDGGFSLVIERKDSEEQVSEFDWSVRSMVVDQIAFPEKATYSGSPIREETVAFFMPGLSESDLELETDSLGIWEASLNKEAGVVEYELSTNAIEIAREELEAQCLTYLDEVDGGDLLINADRGFFRKDGQDRQFSYEIFYSENEFSGVKQRTINVPTLADFLCKVDDSSISFDMSNPGIGDVLATANAEITLAGDVARLISKEDKSYEWVPHNFAAPFQIDLRVEHTSSGTQTFNRTEGAIIVDESLVPDGNLAGWTNALVIQLEAWTIDEVIDDEYEGFGDTLDGS